MTPFVSSSATARNRVERLTVRSVSSLGTIRTAAATCVTFTLDDPVTLSASAVIAAVPSFSARTSPAVSTLATCASALDHANFTSGTAASCAS